MQHLLDKYPLDVVDRASKIKLLITDVDGVLTDGGIIYDDNGLEYKKFNVKDGQIVKILQWAGIKIGAITGRDSAVVKFRLNQLNFDLHHHGIKDKLGKLEEVASAQNLDYSQIAYIGDDIIDIPIFRQCGLAVCPTDAPMYVQPEVHWVSGKVGGAGVFREVADLILAAQDKLTAGIREYLQQKQAQE